MSQDLRKLAKEDALRDFVDSSRRSFFGADPEAAYNESLTNIKRLVEVGRISEAEAVILEAQLKAKTTWSRRVFESQLARITSELGARLETITNKELSVIEAKITELEAKVARGTHTPQPSPAV